jgi:hypothetical protein
MLAFVTCWLAWWLCSLCLALFERNRRNRRRQCLFELGDEEPFRTGHAPRARGARDFSPQRRCAPAAWCEASDDDDDAYSEHTQSFRSTKRIRCRSRVAVVQSINL